VLYRDLALAESAFFLSPDYIHEDKERSGHGFDHLNIGPQFSRGFQAFKIWVSLLAHGRSAYARRISQDAALARYLGELVNERPEFELAAEVGLSICCFRYVPPGLPAWPGREAYLDALNERLMTEIQIDGRAFCSNAVLNGRFVLRACIVNFRTEAADCDRLLDVAAEHGARLDRELRPA
jgi:glutamate/tyrosine decarboxylase-like PLP-dependent enzyme